MSLRYGPDGISLSRDSGYLRRASAPAFWRLIPFRTAQATDSSCGVASVALVINGCLAAGAAEAGVPLVSEAEVLRRTGDAEWSVGSAPGGEGVALGRLGPLLGRALAAWGLERYSVETHFVADPAAGLPRLREALAAIEAGERGFVVANYDQATLVGHGDYGHVSPLAAFDAETDRALILEVDAAWYEPYWVPLPRLAEAMAVRDPATGRSRGWLSLRPRARRKGPGIADDRAPRRRRWRPRGGGAARLLG